jgi:hypothetical protein
MLEGYVQIGFPKKILKYQPNWKKVSKDLWHDGRTLSTVSHNANNRPQEA